MSTNWINMRTLYEKILGVSRKRPNLVVAAVLVTVLVLIYFPVIAGLRTIDPSFYYSGLPQLGRVGIAPFLDPNVGFQGQALGFLSFKDLLHGLLPQWNPFEGLGTPLLGNMQSGPLNVLQIPFDGTYISWVVGFFGHLWIAGFFTVLFIRRKGVSWSISLLAGVAYMLAGSNIWWGGPPLGSVGPLFPLLLYSVELVVETSNFKAIAWLSISIFLVISAGFPETSFLLLGSAYAYGLFSAIRRRRIRPSLTAGATSTVIGLMLSLPILSAFYYALKVSYVVNKTGLGSNYLSLHWFLSLVMPYGFGLVQYPWNPQLSVFWGNVGGFVTPFVILGSLFNLVGLNRKTETWFWAALSGVLIAKTFGGLNFIGRLPLFDVTATYRYADPVWEFGLVVMMAFAVDHISKVRLKNFLPASALYVGIVAFGFSQALPIILNANTNLSKLLLDFAFEVLALVSVVVSYSWVRSRRHIAYIGAFVSMVYAFLPIGFAGSGTISTAIPNMLQQQYAERWGRVATLGPLQPNFGSFYGLPSVNVNDAMMPKRYASFVNEYLLNHGKDSLPSLFVGYDIYTGAPLNVGETLAYYQDLGVRWFVAPASLNLVESGTIVANPIPGNVPVPITPINNTYSVEFSSPYHNLASFRLLLGTYNHPVTGTLSWSISQESGIVRQGRQSLGTVKNNEPTVVNFRPLSVSIRRPLILTFKIMMTSGHLAVWYNDTDSFPNVTLSQNGKKIPGAIYLGVSDKDDSFGKFKLLTTRDGISIWGVAGSMPQIWSPKHLEFSTGNDSNELNTLFSSGPAGLEQVAVVPERYAKDMPHFIHSVVSAHPASFAYSSTMNGRVTLRTRSLSPTVIVLNQVYNRFWQANDDGARLSTFPIDGLYEGILVPKGMHTIEVSYNPPLENAELILSALVMLALIVGLYRTSKHRRSNPPEASPQC